ncbi:hypothetical protein Tco_0011355 [Tanacetum coccineum]
MTTSSSIMYSTSSQYLSNIIWKSVALVGLSSKYSVSILSWIGSGVGRLILSEIGVDFHCVSPMILFNGEDLQCQPSSHDDLNVHIVVLSYTPCDSDISPIFVWDGRLIQGTTYVGYTSQSTPMLKTTGNSSKKDNLSMSNSFSALNEEEEDDEEDVENVYDESANLIQNTKAGGSSSFTAAAS